MDTHNSKRRKTNLLVPVFFRNFHQTVLQEEVAERLDVFGVVAVAEVVWDPRLVEARVVVNPDLKPSEMPKPANTFVVRRGGRALVLLLP